LPKQYANKVELVCEARKNENETRLSAQILIRAQKLEQLTALPASDALPSVEGRDQQQNL
jgi:hypothetical protein